MTITERPLFGTVEILRDGTELIANATNVTARRGGARTGLGVRTDVGLMTFALLNAEDPLAGGTIQPGQQITLQSLAGDDELHELFTGLVVDVASTYPIDKATAEQAAVVTVTVADAVKVHVETPRYGVTIAGGFETFESRIERLADSSLAPIEAPAEGAPRGVYAF